MRFFLEQNRPPAGLVEASCAPPNPDPAQFEHLRLFTSETELRARGDGLGDNPAFRQHRSNELGQAFFRWFLYEHVGITFFGHMNKALRGDLNGVFDGIKIERAPKGGNAPDYLCASDSNSVFLGEAKGRVTPVSFQSAEFKVWRKQFSNVIVTDQSGIMRSLKGYVVATRFASESHPRVHSTLLAEDPSTRGLPWPDGAPPLPKCGRFASLRSDSGKDTAAAVKRCPCELRNGSERNTISSHCLGVPHCTPKWTPVCWGVLPFWGRSRPLPVQRWELVLSDIEPSPIRHIAR